MRSRKPLALLCSLALSAASWAQFPSPLLSHRLGFPASPQQPNVSVPWMLQAGPPNAPFLLLGDAGLTPLHLLGETIWVGPSPTQIVVATGTMALNGASGVIAFPYSSLYANRSLWLSALVVDAGYANGVFGASNPMAQPMHGEVLARRLDLFQPTVFGWTGTFDLSQNTRLQGAPVRLRTHITNDPQGIPLWSPLEPPFHHYGLREQMVFRPTDIGATGAEEQLVGISWRPFFAPMSETFDAFEILAVHSDVVPDYRIDPFSLLPVAPSSGLRSNFLQNYASGETPTSLFAGRYDVRPQDQQSDGTMPYPLSRPFDYDGTRSLLIEYRVDAAPQRGAVRNAHHVRLMALSAPWPSARLVAKGANPTTLVDPRIVMTGVGDNAMHELRLDFRRIKSHALSPWIQVPGPRPPLPIDWLPPAISAYTPAGTTIAFEYRGAADALGLQATAWSSSIDIADTLPFVQIRVTFVANPTSGEVPFVSTIELPVR